MVEGQAVGAHSLVALSWEALLLALLALYMHLRCVISTIITFHLNLSLYKVLSIVNWCRMFVSLKTHKMLPLADPQEALGWTERLSPLLWSIYVRYICIRL